MSFGTAESTNATSSAKQVGDVERNGPEKRAISVTIHDRIRSFSQQHEVTRQMPGFLPDLSEARETLPNGPIGGVRSDVEGPSSDMLKSPFGVRQQGEISPALPNRLNPLPVRSEV